jgi:hypothetical protein
MCEKKSTAFRKLRELQLVQSNTPVVRVYILILLIGGLAGCQVALPTPKPTLEAALMDQSLLTGKPCSAPCWYGLELGKSTKAEVLATLPDLSFADPTTIEEDAYGYWDLEIHQNLPATLISINCRQPQRQCADLTVSNDILVSIGLFPNYELKLGEVVDYLGVPDYVGSVMEQDQTTCKIALWWINRQIRLERSVQNGQALCEAVKAGNRLDPNLTIQRIYYDLPAAFAKIPLTSRDRAWPGFAEP